MPATAQTPALNKLRSKEPSPTKVFRHRVGETWKIKVFIFTYLLVCTASIYFLFSNYAYDDPFITYRYAENIAAGNGFVYNPGERVLSTTTPLFALVLAVLSKLGGNPHQFGLLVGAFSLALGGVFLWGIGRTLGTPEVGWVSLILFPSFPLVVNTLGSETPLYLTLCIGAFLFYIRNNYSITAAFAALAVLARPDGALVPFLLGTDYLLRVRRPLPWRAIILFLVIVLAWIVFAWLYFGSPLPVTLAAKQQQGEMAISQRFFSGFFTTINWYSTWPYRLEAGLALFGLAYMFKYHRTWALILSWTVLYFASYSILGVSRYFWYYSPLVPGFIVLIGLGIAWLHRFAGRYDGRGRIFLGYALPFGLIFFCLYGQVRSLNHLRTHPDSRHAIYQAIGEWLNTHSAPEDKVGSLEVGIIGYYAQRPMVDFAGLLQPEVARQLKAETTYEDAAIYAIDRYRPEYLVLHKALFPRLESTHVSQLCEQLQVFSGNEYTYTSDVLIYRCR